MKQLLILKSSPAYAYNATNGNDLSGLSAGAIMFFGLDDNSKLTAAPTKDFGIALGRSNSPAFVIPEVNVDTLSIVKATYSAGTAFASTITVPTVAAGNTYTVVLIKKGAVTNERNTWTATETVAVNDTTTTANNVAAKIRAYFTAMAESGALPITVSGTNAAITITGKNVGEGWVLKGADDMAGVTPTSVTVATPPVGDTAYIKNLASECAAGKGFTDTYYGGDVIYPGYPEEVAYTQYDVYTLRFQVGRKSAKTRDEKVWQLVHIAVPTNATAKTAVDTILSATGSESSASASES